MPRIKQVKKAQKDQGQCGRCGKPLPAGSGYRYWKFRYGGKRIRCLDAKCAPRGSELTQAKWGAALAAVEDARDGIEDPTASRDTIAGELTQCAENVSAVAEEYREAAEAMGGAGEQMEEWADQLDDAASELDQAASEAEDPETPIDEVRENALAALDNAEGEVCL